MKLGCLYCQKHLLWPRYKFPGVSQNCLYCSGCCPETGERTMHGTVWTVYLMCTVPIEIPELFHNWHFPLISFNFNTEKIFIVLKYVQCKTHHVNHAYMHNSVTLHTFTLLSNQFPEPFLSCKTQFPFPLNENSPIYPSSHIYILLLSLSTLRTLYRCNSAEVIPS